jgi:hypothetical protein
MRKASPRRPRGADTLARSRVQGERMSRRF